MRTTISARHAHVDDALRTRAEHVLERLGHFTTRAQDGAAVFDVIGGVPAAELRMHCAGLPTLVATADGDEHRTALDRAEARMRRQLQRIGTRPRAARHAG